MTSVIRWDGVTKRFGSQVALDNVSLEVPAGSVFALLGENGAGKTTAIRILLGLMEPEAGSSRIVDLDSQKDGLAIRRKVGYVPEQPDLYDWMTVAEIGWFAAGFHGETFWPGYQACIERFRVPPSKKIQQLSKGMRAKVLLSLALAHDPEVLILDEPTSGLDAIVRREFLESMVDRAATGKTVLLSSHQINEVERVADYVAIIRDGRLATVERLDALKDSTRRVTLAVADETSPLPSLPGEVLERRERRRQLDLLLRGADPAALAHLREHSLVVSMEVHPASLEEIFVALMTRNGRGGPSDPVGQGPDERPSADDREQTPAVAPSESVKA